MSNSTVWTVNEKKLKKKCLKYLQAQKCVLWGEAFDIHDEEGLERAAKWLEDVIKETTR